MTEFGPATATDSSFSKTECLLFRNAAKIIVNSGNSGTVHLRFRRMLTGCSVQQSWNENLFHNTLPDSKYITAKKN